MTDSIDARSLDRVQRYLETWRPVRSGRAIDQRDDETLYLGDLINVVWLASEGIR